MAASSFFGSKKFCIRFLVIDLVTDLLDFQEGLSIHHSFCKPVLPLLRCNGEFLILVCFVCAEKNSLVDKISAIFVSAAFRMYSLMGQTKTETWIIQLHAYAMFWVTSDQFTSFIEFPSE